MPDSDPRPHDPAVPAEPACACASALPVSTALPATLPATPALASAPVESANAPRFHPGWAALGTLPPMPLGEAVVSTPLAETLINWAPLLGGLVLPEDTRQLLNSMAGLRALRQGAAIFRHGQAATHLYAVCQGSAGLGRNRRGRADVLMQSFQLRRAVGEGQWLDLHTAWLGRTHDLDACALVTPTLVVEWPVQLAREWLMPRPDAVMALMRMMAGQVQIFNSDLHDLLSKDALGRIAGWLMRRAGPHTRFQLDERKRDVAAQLSISPETFSRMMRQLEQRGLVRVEGYDIMLLDRIALIRLARDV